MSIVALTSCSKDNVFGDEEDWLKSTDTTTNTPTPDDPEEDGIKWETIVSKSFGYDQETGKWPSVLTFEAVVDAIFGADNSKRPKIALQMWIYGLLCSSETRGKQTLNAIYQTARLFTEGILSAPASAEFSRLMAPRLKELLDTICNPEVPFRRTEESKSCQWCDFKKICGR